MLWFTLCGGLSTALNVHADDVTRQIPFWPMPKSPILVLGSRLVFRGLTIVDEEKMKNFLLYLLKELFNLEARLMPLLGDVHGPMFPHLDHGIGHVYQPVVHQLRPGLRAQPVQVVGELGRVLRERWSRLHLIHVANIHVTVSEIWFQYGLTVTLF